jgi:EpsD family peptidyl-prolyl cis-trans isomerase
VRQQLEAARRDIISRAYLERVGETVQRPTPADVEKYYSRKPALFRERRIYDIHEIAIEARAEQVALLTAKVKAAKNAGEFVGWLKRSGLRFADSHSVRAAEQLPLASLDTFAGMSDGQMTISPTPTGATVVVLQSARSQPVDLEHAAPAIEQFLLNERKRDLIAQNLKSLRAAAQIQYLGKFAQSAPPARAASAVTMGVAIK